MSKWIREGGDFLYCLNKHGYNRWSLQVQRGHDDEGMPITASEQERITQVIEAAPEMLGVLKSIYGDLKQAKRLSIRTSQRMKAVLSKLEGVPI